MCCYLFLLVKGGVAVASHSGSPTATGKWKTIMEVGDQSWKDSAKLIMDIYTQRTHGTYIEQKGNALIWQYRDADPEFGFLQSKELEEHLTELMSPYAVQVRGSLSAVQSNFKYRRMVGYSWRWSFGWIHWDSTSRRFEGSLLGTYREPLEVPQEWLRLHSSYWRWRYWFARVAKFFIWNLLSKCFAIDEPMFEAVNRIQEKEKATSRDPHSPSQHSGATPELAAFSVTVGTNFPLFSINFSE